MVADEDGSEGVRGYIRIHGRDTPGQEHTFHLTRGTGKKKQTSGRGLGAVPRGIGSLSLETVQPKLCQ